MLDLVISRHGIRCDFTTLDPTCVAAPPIQLIMWEPYDLCGSVTYTVDYVGTSLTCVAASPIQLIMWEPY